MTVLPGSLDYLYYNGILDCIPYEAYEMPAIQRSANGMSSLNQTLEMVNNAKYNKNQQNINSSQMINGSAYLDSAKSGMLYNNPYASTDQFVQRNNNAGGNQYSIIKSAYGVNNGQGTKNDFETVAYGKEGKDFRTSVTNGISSVSDKFMNAPTLVKGVISLGLIIGTAFLLFKGKFKKH